MEVQARRSVGIFMNDTNTGHRQSVRRVGLVWFLAVLLVLLISAGCSGTTTSSTAATSTDTTAPAPTVAAQDADCPPERPTTVVYPEKLEGYVPGAYMGWQDTQARDKRFPETVGYTRDNWPVFEPEEGAYDWSKIEDLRSRMVAEGGKISFRIQTVKPPPWGSGHGVPDWLLERGAEVREGSLSEEPLYSNCLFLEAHGTFINAMRQRYDGDPDVAFIDVGSYGFYGEWHSDQYNMEPESLDWHARRRIIDMYLGGAGTRPCTGSDGQEVMASYQYEGFQSTRLMMPYTPGFSDSLYYALNQRQDVGIRHDALGSERHQEKYRSEIADLIEKTWPRAPIAFEFYPESYTPDALRSARDFAWEMHASYLHENFDEQGDDALIERILERMGYRLLLREIRYTSELRPGETFSVEMFWENIGVAPPYVTSPLVVLFANQRGEAVWSHQFDVFPSEWPLNEPVPLQEDLPLPDTLPSGTYDLKVAFVEPETEQPLLAIAIAGRDVQGYYSIGKVRIDP